jgi:hypothetical protein
MRPTNVTPVRRAVDRGEPCPRVVDLPLFEPAHVQIERRGDLGVTGEVRDLGRVSARADEVRDRRVPEVVERDLLNPLGVEALLIGCPVEPAHRDVAEVHRCSGLRCEDEVLGLSAQVFS